MKRDNGKNVGIQAGQPPSGGCVLKLQVLQVLRIIKIQPPSGGCVLKPDMREITGKRFNASRLQAAVC